MTKPNDGGPAFPCDRFGEPGMSLRDYIAIHARASDVNKWHQKLGEDCNWSKTPTTEQAKYAYADAMLRAREKDE